MPNAADIKCYVMRQTKKTESFEKPLTTLGSFAFVTQADVINHKGLAEFGKYVIRVS